MMCILCPGTGSVDELLVSESRGSSVGIETGYVLDGRSWIPIFSLPVFKPALGPTQPLMQ
jgi:hypothetical protein